MKQQHVRVTIDGIVFEAPAEVTIIQAYASSLTAAQWIAGKALVYVLVGVVEFVLCFALGMFVFGYRIPSDPAVLIVALQLARIGRSATCPGALPPPWGKALGVIAPGQAPAPRGLWPPVGNPRRKRF